MENDLMDIFEPEKNGVEQALKALEEAAFPPEPEPGSETENEQGQEIETEAAEEDVSVEKEPAEEETVPGEEKTEDEPASDDEEAEEETVSGEEPVADETCEPEPEMAESDGIKSKLQLILSRIRTLAEQDRRFTIAVAAAAAVLVVLLIAAALLPGKDGEDVVQEEPAATESVEDNVTTLYITRVEKPGAPEKEYVPVAGTEVVEKTPLFWGIDVSEHQQEIDWKTVSSAGVDFAMIRAGYRGYTEGQIYADEYFKTNMREAHKAGVDVGVYFFSQATSVEEAVEEAKFVLELIKVWDITYPVVFDWEFIENSTARTYSMTAKEVTDCAMAFCETIAYAGYTPMIYFGQNASIEHFDLERLMVFDFWLADYTDTPVFPYDFQMWQYTSNGQVAGIDGDVDVNYCFSEYKTTEASQ
ncbi:MAG: hypothetical protein E7430_02515 [Ruminococcaceae bacterium]|nr:hypothetical protein [Oscillospiraceae bacterium]